MLMVKQAIREVWGDYDDFAEGGYPYVAFVISQDLQDMEDDEYDESECVEELADIIINATRMLDERGHDPERAVLGRVNEHNRKGPEQLIKKYQARYEAQV